jgi:DNA ligase 1
MARSNSLRFAAAGTLLCGMFWIHPSIPVANAQGIPPLLLANAYHAGIDLGDYWVSEKYDGVRGYWDGRRLLTRAGNVIEAPVWFLERLPPLPLDGELWMGPGSFEATAATVRDHWPDEAGWRRIQFLVFDLPAHTGLFDERRVVLNALVTELDIPWVHAVARSKVRDAAQLETMLRRVTQAGGEGLMLQRGSSAYRAGRSDDLLKLKRVTDAEAVVVGYLPGKGKYAGMLGALIVQRPDGLRFHLGSGMTDQQRAKPPPLGARVTYTHQGVTARGVPRFARFVHVRDEEP